MKKFIGLFLLVVALCGIGVGSLTLRPQEAHAQSQNVDTWTGKYEVPFTFSQSVTSGTSAVVLTSSTTVRWNVRAMTVTDSASGVITFYDSSAVDGTKVLFQIGVLANSPVMIPEHILRQGIRPTLGNGLYLSGATGTITVSGLARKDSN